MLLALAILPATATSLSLRDETVLEDGVTLRQYRASSPSTDVWVLEVQLCTDGVYLDATRDPDELVSTGTWAGDQDATAATNGDFYKTDPVRVYGDAIGGGVRWPSGHTGWDSAYADEWYWEHYGWIAFGHDWVEFSHTGWVKENISGLTSGWGNTDPTPPPRDGTLALVSGFPELVIEGVVVTCSSPTDSDCFPDRSDMRDRHPRSAMGITEDRETFFLVVADGRTDDNDGLYGAELADIMGQLGAWEAFNLDGGGSSQMWTDADGYVNDYDGNNYGSGARSVANHWAVFAGGRDWLPDRPGHCASAPACGEVPAGGAILDDSGACFRSHGPQQYWRTAADGYGGSLHWTNAWEGDRPYNWAWWQLEIADPGTYEVLVYTEPTYSVDDDVGWVVAAAGTEHESRVDPTAGEGWLSLGTYDFAAGGEQWVAVYDHQDEAVGSDQHIAADAVQLVRVGAWCGDGACDADEDCSCADCPPVDEIADNGVDDDCDGETDEAGDTGPGGDTGETGDSGTDSAEDPTDDSDAQDSLPGAKTEPGAEGCGCGHTRGSGESALLAVLGLAALARRRA